MFSIQAKIALLGSKFYEVTPPHTGLCQEQCLTHSMPQLPSYRDHSIDLLRKSIDWFLYDANFGVK